MVLERTAKVTHTQFERHGHGVWFTPFLSHAILKNSTLPRVLSIAALQLNAPTFLTLSTAR
jgi:hypothetical protein